MRGGDTDTDTRRSLAHVWRIELRQVARIAAPAAVTQLGLMLMGVVDSMMLGRLSAVALAAGALGHSVSMGAIVFVQGVLMAVDPMVAQAWGRGDRRWVAATLRDAALLASVATLPLMALLAWTEPWLHALGQPPQVAAEAASYNRAVVAGILPYLLFVVGRQGLQAMGIVRPALLAILLANGVNVVANYGLIFGRLGMPALGVTGSGLATSASRWAMLVALLWIGRTDLAPFLRRWRWRWRGMISWLPLLRIGLPIGLHVVVEFWMITAFALMMGYLGATALAGHQVALVLAALAYMVPLGVSGAAAARVGQAIGRRDEAALRAAAAVGLVLGTLVMTVSATIFVVAPLRLAHLFTHDTEVVAVAVALLPIAALFQVFDGLQVVAAGVLRGAADTRVPAIVALAGYWVIGLPLGYLLIFSLDAGPRGAWWGLSAGLGFTAVVLLWRVIRRLGAGVEPLAREASGVPVARL